MPDLNALDSAVTLATENGHNLEELVSEGIVTGTGKNGRVVKEDVQKFLDKMEKAEEAEAEAEAAAETAETEAEEAEAAARAAEKAAAEAQKAQAAIAPDAAAFYELTGTEQMAATVAGTRRVLFPGRRLKLAAADPVVQRLVQDGALRAL